jgi:ABC-2 type transport system ATP-binding protein
VIEVAHLSKVYRVHKRPPGLAAALRSMWRRKFEPVQALDDLSFAIAAGERVGFLGPTAPARPPPSRSSRGSCTPRAAAPAWPTSCRKQRATAFLKTITLVMGQKQQLCGTCRPARPTP